MLSKLFRSIWPICLLVLLFLIYSHLGFAQIYQIDLNNGDTLTTCSGFFYDSGDSTSFYSDNEYYVITFCSDNGGTMGLDFKQFDLHSTDTLFIFDGPDTLAALIGAYTGEGLTFGVASSDTCLTLIFKSDANFTRAGWKAEVICDLCVHQGTSAIVPDDDTVCVSETINYSVDDHAGSTYTWTVVNGSPVSLVDGPNNLDVTWSAVGGISGTIKVVETNWCGEKDSSSLIVDIYNLPVVSFSGLASDYCIDDASVALTGNPVGGSFSGLGISVDQFDPGAAGVGMPDITYTYTDIVGCTNDDVQSTTVHELPVLSISGLDTLYDITDPVVLLVGNPAGGTFSGPGVSGDNFDPASAGLGIHDIIYNYSDVFGCANSDTQSVEIRDYDFKAGARILGDIDNWCSQDAEYSTVGATGDEPRPGCWSDGPNYNRWFKFQAIKEYVVVSVKTGGDEGTLQYPRVAVMDESSTVMSCSNYIGQYNDIQVSTPGLTIGDWYYINVDNLAGATRRGTFTLCVADTIDYDFKAGAIELTDLDYWCSGDAAFTTVGATSDGPKGSCWNSGSNYDRWFKFQATTNQINIDLKIGGSEGTMDYPYIALWDTNEEQIACARYAGRYDDLRIGSDTLTPGEWYYITVDNYIGDGYRGSFTLCVSDTIDYDFKSAAIELTDLDYWCSGDAAFTTVGATSDGPKGSCWNSGSNYDRWFKFQATTNQINIDLKIGGSEGTMDYPYIALWDTNEEQIACARYAGRYDDLRIGSDTLTPGEWYYITVDNYIGDGYRGSFTLCVSDTIDYDFKSAAIELTDLDYWCSGDAAFTTVGATSDGPKGSCWNSGSNYDRWFKFQATTNQINIDLKIGGSEGTMDYPYIALWDTNEEQIACARYAGRYDDLRIGSDTLTPGEWYYITVDNYIGDGYRGSFTLCVSDTIDYDFKSAAIELTDLDYWCSGDAAFTTVGATSDGPKGSCWNSGSNYDRWFKFQATTNQINIDLKIGGSEGTMDYPYIALWDTNEEQIACARYAGRYDDLRIGSDTLTPGEWYYITVDNYIGDGYRGSFTLCVSDTIDYDFKSAAIELTDLDYWCSGDAAFTTVGATSDGPKGSCWNSGSNYDRWFKFQATTNQINIDLKIGGSEGTMDYPYIALWDTNEEQIACARYAGRYDDLRIGSDTLTPGEWYYITVDNYIGDGYRGSFTLCVSDTIDYDFKSAAHEISNYADYCSELQEFTTVAATADGYRGSCWNSGPNYNRWFRFRATGTDVSISLKTGAEEGSLQYPYLALWDSLDVELSCARYATQYGDLEMVYTALTPGEWYYITVDNLTSLNRRGTFTLCIDDEINYDYFEGAITLSDLDGWCSNFSEYSTINATSDQSAGSCWVNGPNYNRWFKFQAPSASAAIQVRIDGPEGTLGRPFVALWDTNLVQISCNTYISDDADIEIASTSLIPGEWYFISVDNSTPAGYRGSFTLCLTESHINDDKANAIEITDLNGWCSDPSVYSNIIATADELEGSCWTPGINNNVWFKFTATGANVTVDVKTGNDDGEMRDQQVALWTTGGTEVACAGPLAGSGTLSMPIAGLTPGNTYYISVDDNATSGTFTLCVDDGQAYPFPPGAVEINDIDDWCSPYAAYSNIGETNAGPEGSCWTGGTFNNKWFRFQATTDQIRIQVKTGSLFGNMERQQVALFNTQGIQVSCSKWLSNSGTILMQSDTLNPGDWYWFAVDDDRTSGSFSLCVDDSVDYDYRISAIELNDLNDWCSNDAAYNNRFATDDENLGSCWSGSVNKNVWFKFTASTSYIKARVRTGGVYGNMERQQVSLWNADGTEVACARWISNQGTITLQTDTLTAGNNYWISVDDDRTSGSFTLCVDDSISYDFQAGAIQLTDLDNWCSNDAVYNNTFATDDGDVGTCWSGTVNKNVWFRFNAETNYIKVRVRTGGVYGNMERQQVSLWNTNDIEVACAKWISNQGTITLQTDTLTIGNEYWISVDDDRTSGSFSLCLDKNIDYDYQAGAIELTDLDDWCSGDATYNNTFATDDGDIGSCWSGSINKNVWFTFVPTNTNFIKVGIRTGGVYGNMERQQVSLWNADGTEVACARWVSNQGTVTLQIDTLTIGDRYWISVDDDRTSGSFTLCVDENYSFDYLEGALEIPDQDNWCSNDGQYSNLFATDDRELGTCWSGSVNKNVWFKFNAESRFAKISIKTGSVYGSMSRQQVSLWDEAGDEVGCARWVTNTGTVTVQADSLSVGNQYYISIDDDNTSGSFTICFDKNPDYNYMEGAEVINNISAWCSSDANYSNLFATDDRDMGSCWLGAVNKNVWFTFVATNPFIRVQVKTGTVYGNMQSQQAALWNEAMDEVACVRYITNQGTITLQIDSLTAGKQYWISVDDNNVSGSFTLCLDDIPDYDFRAGAVLLNDLNNWCSSESQYSNISATMDQAAASCWAGTNDKNVWFKFQAIQENFEARVRTGTVYGTMRQQEAAIWNENGNEVSCATGTAVGDLSITIDTLTAGNWYYISVDDNQTSGTFTLCVEGDPLYVDITGTDVTCNGFNDGTAQAIAGGGTGPGTYTYQWTGPGSFSSTSPNITNLIPGTYNLTVRDVFPHMVTGAIIINEPAALAVVTDKITPASCAGSTDGAVEITPSGGYTPYTYAWTGPGAFTSSAQDISGLEPGTYNLILTDSNSCTTPHAAIVTVLDTIAPVITCPSNAIENADASCQFTLPDYTAGVATDNCGVGLVVTQDPAAATIISGHGTIQIVKLVATDASGNADSCTFTVTLNDVTDPVATSQDTTVYLDAAGSVTIDSSFVNDGSADNCGIATITFSQSTFTCAEAGPNLITMTVTDVAGLTQCYSDSYSP